ncbi:MAG: small multi-drug export protein [bacterium]
MDDPLKVLAVFGAAIVEIWAAVPTGFYLGLHPIEIALISAAGGLFGVALVFLLGEPVRNLILRRYKRQMEEGKSSRIREIWFKYGIIGLGLLAPWLTGAPLGVALGLLLGARPRQLLIWISLGTILCSILLTISAALTIAGIDAASR